ncbi:PepSY domain-containing protein [Pseudoneobacillus sp. C159]
MRWSSFLLGVVVGAVSGYAANKYITEEKFMSAEKVLENAKKRFKEQGPISGSWIQMKVESYDKNTFVYQVYRGGISRGREQIEFIADAKTGALLDVYSL